MGLLSKARGTLASPVAQGVKNLPTRDLGLIPEWGGSPGEGNGSPLQYSCLESSMDRGASRAAVHGIAALDTTEYPALTS